MRQTGFSVIFAKIEEHQLAFEKLYVSVVNTLKKSLESEYIMMRINQRNKHEWEETTAY